MPTSYADFDGDDFDDVTKLLDYVTAKYIYDTILLSQKGSVIAVSQANELFNKYFDEWIEYVEDRPFNDQRYYISNKKVKELGWDIEISLMDGLKSLV